MTSIVLRHATTSTDRLTSIQKQGLVPHKPTEDGNYTFDGWSVLLADQPRGVYAMPVGQFTWPEGYVVEFAYCGPFLLDPKIKDAVVIESTIPPESLTVL